MLVALCTSVILSHCLAKAVYSQARIRFGNCHTLPVLEAPVMGCGHNAEDFLECTA